MKRKKRKMARYKKFSLRRCLCRTYAEKGETKSAYFLFLSSRHLYSLRENLQERERERRVGARQKGKKMLRQSRTTTGENGPFCFSLPHENGRNEQKQAELLEPKWNKSNNNAFSPGVSLNDDGRVEA